MKSELLQRITIEPGQCGSRPWVRGKRLRVTSPHADMTPSTASTCKWTGPAIRTSGTTLLPKAALWSARMRMGYDVCEIILAAPWPVTECVAIFHRDARRGASGLRQSHPPFRRVCVQDLESASGYADPPPNPNAPKESQSSKAIFRARMDSTWRSNICTCGTEYSELVGIVWRCWPKIMN